MKLILHIGTHKTGSTAIQSFLWKNRDAVAAKGVFYPAAHVTLNAHHQLAWALGANHPLRDRSLTPEKVAGDILEEARKAGCERVIVSSEDFERLFDDAAIGKLKALFAPLPVQVVLYIRRQDEALLSSHNQQVKTFTSRYKGTIEDLTQSQALLRRLDYWSLTQRWAKIFGDEALAVRRYDPKQFPDGDVVQDFLAMLGITLDAVESGKWRSTNKSIHPVALDVIRRVNSKDISRDLHLILRKLLMAQSKDLPVSKPALPADARREFLRQFDESNAMVARKWFPESDGVLFREPVEASETPTSDKPHDEVVIDLLIDSLIAAVKKPPGRRWRLSRFLKRFR